MKYRQLPLERDWAGRPADEIERDRGILLTETMSTRGFQIVTGVLRNLEREALHYLRCGAGKADHMIGRIQCIEAIRRSLVGILPAPQQPKVDWFDQESEGFILDEGAPDDDNG